MPKQPTESKPAGKKPSPKDRGNLEVLRTRIVGHEDVSPDLLTPHALNFRRHPESQMKALKGSLDDLGWIKTVLVNKRTGTIIDGHARVEEAKRRKLKTIPVTYLDLSKEEENKALALLDPITEMAKRDDVVLNQLIDSISSRDENVQAMMKRLKPLKDDPDSLGIGMNTSTQVLEYRTDVLFPSSNEWGIPDLRADMLYDGEAPTTTWPAEDDEGRPQFFIWGSGAIDERIQGKILCFYTDDYRFETLWNESVETIAHVVPLKPLAATVPDYSLWSNQPRATQIYNIYRARWVARYWQECGVKIIPSLATCTDPYCYKFAFDGLPKRPSLMSMQMRAGGVGSKQLVDAYVRDVAELIARVSPERLVIYGASNRSRIESALPGGIEYIWSNSFTEARIAQGAFNKRKTAQRSKP